MGLASSSKKKNGEKETEDLGKSAKMAEERSQKEITSGPEGEKP